MNYNFDNERPIYLQIVEILKEEIISGILKPNQKLPSVREYATIFKANPNTVVKALIILEQKGYIYTERTNGKFVSDNINLFKSEKEILLKEKVLNNSLSNKIDYLILTHSHLDHNGEAQIILDQIKVNNLVISAYDNSVFTVSKKTNVLRVRKNDKLYLKNIENKELELNYLIAKLLQIVTLNI